MRTKILLIAFTIMLTSIAVARAEEPVGTQYFSQVMPISGTRVIFPATSNVNGATIRTTSIWTTNNGQIALVANYPDGTQRTLFIVAASPSQNNSGNLGYSLRLPAGVGLSAISTYGISGVGAGAISITYDLY